MITVKTSMGHKPPIQKNEMKRRAPEGLQRFRKQQNDYFIDDDSANGAPKDLLTRMELPAKSGWPGEAQTARPAISPRITN